jgi:Zn-finger nucleic acid-binding protein
VRCASCDAELVANVFPGGAVRCPACGAENRTSTAPHHAAPAAVGPYRAPEDRPTIEPPDVACPFCGGMCRPAAATCPHCEVRLSKIRCPTCFTLQTTGDRACARCGHALELEPMLDPMDAPCPRCEGKLSSLGDRGMVECAACGGLFVDHASLARIVAERGESGPLPVKDARPFERASHAVVEAQVRYLKCPQCHHAMNRVNFGRKSGVVVDVCKVHGTWFDAGELTQAVEWVASGGLALAKQQIAAAADAAQKNEERAQRISKAQAEVHVAMMTESMRETRALGRRVALTEDLVDAAIRALLWW